MKKNLTFDINDIKNLSTEISFSRGEDYYYSGSVKKITRNGNKFEGIVQGTEKYKVTLEIQDDELYFNCNCPYDFEGICKHSIAFALAILDGKYKDNPELIRPPSKVNPREFKEYFNKSDTSKKLNFLKQLLDKDTNLQDQFIAFTKNKSEDLDSITRIDIDSIKEEVHNDLSLIDFDDIVDNYDPYEGGNHDDEGYFDLAYDEIRNVFEPHLKQAVEFIRKGNLLDTFRIILGLFEGSWDLPDNEKNEYEIFYESYSIVAINQLYEQLNSIIREVDKVVKSNESVYRVLDMIFQRYNLYKEQYIGINEEEEEDDEYDEMNINNLKFFEQLFISLLTNKETAEYFYNIIQQNNLETIQMAFVILKIAEITENEDLWIKTAENFAECNHEIAEHLMEKYKQKNEEKDFNRIAEFALKKWPDIFDLYLIDNLNKKSEKTLYIKALKNYTARKQSIKHYWDLREYLTEAQKKEFINKTREEFDNVFYVQLLEIEKRYKDILSFVRKNEDVYFDFEKMILPIVNIYPDECFEMIIERCNEVLDSSNRGRNAYQMMVRWLKVMNQIETKQTETRQYIKSLYNHKPGLPALRDELRNAHLITN